MDGKVTIRHDCDNNCDLDDDFKKSKYYSSVNKTRKFMFGDLYIEIYMKR